MRSVTKEILLCAMLVVCFSACERDFSARPSWGDICFSADTLDFGTILPGETTPVGYLTLHNTSGEDVTIESISLAGEANGLFDVNINGVPTKELTNVRLRHSDSLYVFVNVVRPKARPDRARTMLVDHLVVRSQSNLWQATLTATVLNVIPVAGVIAEPTAWSQDSIAYYVTDTLTVGRNASLSVGSGVTVLMGPRAALRVEGSLEAKGTVESPVLFRHVRQDEFYDDVPGQWGGVVVASEARATLSNVTLACCAQCLQCDSASALKAYSLTVRDGAHSGIELRHAEAEVANSLIYNCGGPAIAVHSSKLSLVHSTLSNYYDWDYRKRPTLHVTAADTLSLSMLSVINSIVMGNLSNEVEVDSVRKLAPQSVFSHSMLRVEKSAKVQSDTVMFVNCVVSKKANFVDRTNNDYHLKPSSDAVGTADMTIAAQYPLDIEGAARPQAETSQMGAYETLPAQE